MKAKFYTNSVVIAVVLLLALSTGIAQSHDTDRGHKEQKQMKRSMPIMSMAKELNLTDEQMEKIKNLHHDFEKKQIKMDADKEIAELDFRKMMMEDASQKDLNKQADVIANKMAEKRKLHINMQFKMKSNLSGEQWKSWKKQMHGRKMKSHKQRGHRMEMKKMRDM